MGAQEVRHDRHCAEGEAADDELLDGGNGWNGTHDLRFPESNVRREEEIAHGGLSARSPARWLRRFKRRAITFTRPATAALAIANAETTAGSGRPTSALATMEIERVDTNRVMAEALRRKVRGDFSGAHETLESALAAILDTERDARAELLAFKADLYDEEGSYADAKRIYEDVVELSSGDPYRRYSIELSLGALCERLRDADDAARWYVAAINTALSSDGVSSGSAVKRLVSLRGDRLNTDERALCERGIDHSWDLLGLSGEPDRLDLARSASMLIDAAAEP